MISFIMMAKNEEFFISDAIASLQKESDVEWQLIIVDDHSKDGTKSVAKKFTCNDSRIQVFSNPGQGKVSGTNFGYTQCSGEFIKCIDSDDVLRPRFFSVFRANPTNDVLFHSNEIVDEKLHHISYYYPNPAWIRSDYRQVLERLISIPKCSWSFARQIADKVFPLPQELPFEDVWMSLMIKKHSRNPLFVREPLYLYRQHANQTFGGILNFSRSVVTFRAKRLLRLIEVLEKQPRAVGGFGQEIFSSVRKENMFLSGYIGGSELLLDNQLRRNACKLVLMKYFPSLAPEIAKLKWRLEALVATDDSSRSAFL